MKIPPLGNSINRSLPPITYHCSLLTVLLLVLVCCALCPMVQAVVPAPDGGYPGGNTAEGQTALLSLTTGTYNTAVGLFSLRSNTEGNFNTGVGAAALLANTADENTATGAGTLLTNTTGFGNTANGAFALFSNTGGVGNTAIGTSALFSNTTGNDNTATGRDALGNNSVGNNNTALGRGAGGGITTGSNIIAIGFGVSGISTVAGQVDDSCYIGNIHGAGIEPMTSAIVFVDADGKLGTDSFADGQGGNVSLPELLKDHRKLEEQAASIAALKSTVGILTAQLKEQAAQIQKVSARLEAKDPAPQMASLSAVARALPDEGGNNQ